MRSSDGFTIIELSLFVAISALIMVSLMVGWSVTINTQSYKDSARSLAQVLQQQYSNAISVSNDRTNPSQIKCGLSGSSVTVDEAPSGAAPVGASNCVIMGRYITIDGTVLHMGDIIGAPSATASSATTDTDAIKNYYPTKVASSVVADETYNIAWSSRPYIAGAPDATAKLAIVVVRSPLTGTLYTYSKQFTDSDNPPSVKEIMDTGTNPHGQNAVKLCLDPEAPIAQGRMAVQIKANAASTAGVAVLADADVDAEAGC